MKLRYVISALACFAIVCAVVLSLGLRVFHLGTTVITAASAPAPAPAPTSAPTPASTTASTSNPIVLENAQQGTTDWMITDGHVATTQIQAYASAPSVYPGHTLTFYVSTIIGGTPYSVDFYRLGWYGGKGGRLMFSQNDLIGHAQGYYDLTTHHLLGCATCSVDAKIGLIEANWQPSYTLAVPSNWTTGVYLAKFTDYVGLETYVTFDVLGDPHSLYIAVTADVTDAAYNDWGGYSLYYGYNSQGLCSACRAVKVSFDRPNTYAHGSGQVLDKEADAIRWLERQGYDLSYMSTINLQEDPSQLLQHRAFLALGHSEYWTKEMRDGVENARDSGIGLAFLSGNDMYWQVRLESDSPGTPDRTVVCYRVSAYSNDLALDPIYGKDNSRLTAQWRDPALARPENSVIGIMYTSSTDLQQGFPWQLNPQADTALLARTGLQPGQTYGCDIVGNEWDRAFTNGASPADLHILGLSHTLDYNHQSDIGETTYYIAPSGAIVFAAGAIYWTTALDSYRFSQDPMCTGQNLVVPGLQKLMANVMEALVIHHRVQ